MIKLYNISCAGYQVTNAYIIYIQLLYSFWRVGIIMSKLKINYDALIKIYI